MPIIEAGVPNSDGKLDPNQLTLLGPSIRVSIGHFRGGDAANTLPKEDEFAVALVDTGATESCIDISLAQKLELPIVDKITISGANNPIARFSYMTEMQEGAADLH